MTTTRHEQQTLDSMPSHDAVATFLMSRPGERFTAVELAAELDRPVGTVQSAAGKLHAARMRSTMINPVGVYAFRPTAECRYITYGFRTDRPFDSDLHPVKDSAYRGASKSKPKPKGRRASKKNTTVLIHTEIDGVYLVEGAGELVRLVHVEIVDA